MAYWSKDFILEFIKIYKEEECLWKVRSSFYHDKQRREKSYRRLLLKVREIDPGAQRDIIIKKIKNLRTVFRKEEKQVRDSLRHGASIYDVYSPRLWYYKELEFLADQEDCKPPVSRFSPERNGDVQESSNSQELFEGDIEMNIDGNPPEEDDTFLNAMPGYSGSALPRDPESPCSTTLSTDPVQDPSSSTATRETPAQSQKRVRPGHSVGRPNARVTKRKTSHSGDGVQHFAREKFSTGNIPQLDKFDTFGQFVAQNLREMTPEQHLNAQILISEVIYEGHMRTLSRHSQVLASPHNLPATKY